MAESIKEKNMLIKIKFTLILLFITFNVFAQQNELSKIIPPSPNAANLAAFFEKPIGLYTGSPQVSIPIYVIKGKDIELPITLSYNSGGIKVADIASWVGLGWNLNAGGQITRSIVGLADEMPSYGYLHTPVLSTDNLDSSDPSTQGIIISSVRGELDNQPDQFHFSIPSGSGKFMFNKSGGINSVPLNNYKFKPDVLQRLLIDDIFPEMDATPKGGPNNKNYAKWEIVDDKGTIYKFEEFETSCATNRDIARPSEVSGGFPSINTWLLTEVLSLNGEYIKFKYDSYKTSHDIKLGKIFNAVNPQTIDLNYEMYSAPPTEEPIMRQYSYSRRLSSIEFNSGVIRFIPTQLQRADLIGDKALDKIVIEDRAGQVLKQFKFEYDYLNGDQEVAFDYFSSEMGDWNNYYRVQEQYIGSAKPITLRMVLKGIRELDGNSNPSNEGYKLDYFAGLPERTSDRTDYWGYFSGKRSPEFKFITNNDYRLENIAITNKEPDLASSKAGALAKIMYPNKGTTTFDYGLNQINAASAAQLPDKVEEVFGSDYMTIRYPEFDQLNLPYVTRRIFPGKSARHYYMEFNIPEYLSLVEVKINIQQLPPNASNFNFYLENTVNPQPIDDPLWGTATNGEYVVQLSPGTYRLYHNPFTEIINNPQHQYYYSTPSAHIAYNGLKITKSDGVSDRYAGGIRVNSIIHFDPVSGAFLKSRFQYKEARRSSGYLAGFKPVFLYSKWNRMEETVNTGYPGVRNHAVQEFKYSCNSFYPLSITNGSYVGYSTVEEIIGEANDAGKTVNVFSSPKNFQDNIFDSGIIYQMPTPSSYGFDPWYPFSFDNWRLPSPPVDDTDWKRGLLLQQEFYKNNGTDNFSLIKKVENDYEYPSVDLSFGVDVGYVMRNVINSDTYSTGEAYLLRPYTLRTGIAMLKKSVETAYDNVGNSTTNSVSYTNSLKSLRPIIKEVIASDGSIIREYYTYPREYAAGTTVMDNLVAQNIVAVPVESVVAKEEDSNIHITNARLNEYYSIGAGLLKSIKSIDIDSPLPHTSFKFSNAPTGLLPSFSNATSYAIDPDYENRFQFNIYSPQGNLLEQQVADGSKISYIWSYNSQYPIAEIKNANYATVESILGGAIAVNNFSSSSPTDQQVKDFISQLRNSSLLEHAQITSYTYKPLVGMTSMTDAKGMTTYYEYDEFQRLKNVKDQNKNIINQTDYHYKN